MPLRESRRIHGGPRSKHGSGGSGGVAFDGTLHESLNPMLWGDVDMELEQSPRRWAAFHGGILLASFGLVPLSPALLTWPWYLLLPVASYAAIVSSIPALRRSVPRLSAGRIGGSPLAVAVALAILTSAVLVTFHVLFHPDVSALAASIPVAALQNRVLAGVCFSIANALLEELIFRWVLYEAISAEWGAGMAIGATSLLFGLGHLQGYPPGLLGAFMAAAFGLALALLRCWTGGLGLTVGCHVFADATIFCILFSSGAFDDVGG